MWHLVKTCSGKVVKEEAFDSYDECINNLWLWSFCTVMKTGNAEVDREESKKKYEIYPLSEEDYKKFMEGYPSW